MSLGYDHQDTFSLESQFGAQDGASELVDGRVGWRFIPTATAGGEVTYSHTTYDQAILNNNSLKYYYSIASILYQTYSIRN